MNDVATDVITMLDGDMPRIARANAAQRVLTHLYGGNPVPAVWPNSRESLLELARETRGLRAATTEPLAPDVPSGTLQSTDYPTDKEPRHE